MKQLRITLKACRILAGAFSLSLVGIVWRKLPNGLKQKLLISIGICINLKPTKIELMVKTDLYPEGTESTAVLRFTGQEQEGIVEVTMLPIGEMKFNSENLAQLEEAFGHLLSVYYPS